MSIEKIDKLLSKISNLLTLPLDKEIEDKLNNQFMKILSYLFSEDLAFPSLKRKINSLLSDYPDRSEQAKQLNYEYVQRIAALKKLVDTLPDNFLNKNSLISYIDDNCSNKWLELYNQNLFTNSQADFIAFRKEHGIIDLNNTVEVITWGTEQESGNGLKNVIRQKIEGESIGHAALMIRIPVNPENKKLVEQYCLNKHGSIKIPYKITRHPCGPIYEIYWSFWPDRLQKFKQDVAKERGGFEFISQNKQIEDLPCEVKSYYMHERSRKTFFGTNRIVSIAPIVVPKLSHEPKNIDRQDYVNLKLERYKLKDQISSLFALRRNYLDEDQEFDPSQQWIEKPIKASSNFLNLLQRFKKDLDLPEIPRIIQEKKISHSEANKLYSSVVELINNKHAQSKKIKGNLNNKITQIYFPHSRIKKIKNHIKILRREMADYEYYETNKEIWELLNTQINPTLPSEAKIFFEKIELGENEASRITSSTVLDPQDLQMILNAIKKYGDKFSNITESKKQLTIYSEKLEALVKDPTLFTMDNIQEKISKLHQLKYLSYNALKELSQISIEVEKEFKEIKPYISDKIIEIEKLLVLEKDNPNFMCDFVYYYNRDKTAHEKAQFGNFIYNKDLTQRIWEVKTLQDLKDLLVIVKKDQIDIELGILPKELNLFYNNKRPLTREELNQFGNLIYNNKDLAWRLKCTKDIEDLEKIINKDILSLDTKILLKSELYKNLPLHSPLNQLKSKFIFRGIPTNNVILRDFNITNMLKKASELASNTSSFNLFEENCSTTSMKILHSGAPFGQKIFKWTENKQGQPAANTFLTNPQAVHAVSTLFSRAQQDDQAALDQIQKESLAIPNSNYFQDLNALALLKGDKKAIVQKFKDIIGFNFASQLMKDLWIFKDTKKEKTGQKEIDEFLSSLDQAIKSQDYILIQEQFPGLAISIMKNKLQESPQGMPFFDKLTLQLVQNYILKLEAKSSKNPVEIKELQDYAAIIKERDDRVECIEKALAAALDISESLKQREQLASQLEWSINKEEAMQMEGVQDEQEVIIRFATL